MYFNVNFNVFYKLIKVHLLVSEIFTSIIYIFQILNHTVAVCNDFFYKDINEIAYCMQVVKVHLNTQVI